MCKVSVIVPVYNLESYIEKCILSIQSQTLKDIEIIIVNDGSTDKTGEIIKKLASQDIRIKIINKQNGGILAARGSGFEAAKGEYILYIDGDDWIENDCCEVLYKAVIKNKSDMVICDFYEEYDNKTLQVSSGDFKKINANEYMRSYFKGQIRSYVWIKLIKRELLEGIDFTKGISLGDDSYLSILLSKKLNSVIKVDQPLIHYVIRQGSLTKKYDNSVFDIWKIIKFLQEDLYFQNVIHSLKEEFEFFVYNHVFLGRVVEKPFFNSMHTDMYNLYMKEDIDIYSNTYYKHSVKTKHKILTRFYFWNYSLGNIVNRILDYIIKMKNNHRYTS